VEILWIKVNRMMSKLLTQSAEISEFPPESSQIVEVVFLVDFARFRCQLFLDEVENGISQLEFTKKNCTGFSKYATSSYDTSICLCGCHGNAFESPTNK
jgi:hypothetical protein